jgi:hypothetical protein
MAVKKDVLAPEITSVTVSTGDATTTTVYVGGYSVDFVDGSATVSPEIAALLKDIGFGV